MKTPNCCEQAQLHIYWLEAGRLTQPPVGPAYLADGPEREGWAIAVDAIEEAYNLVYVNVSYCPFCGAALPVEVEA